jgi:hypothetical protein
MNHKVHEEHKDRQEKHGVRTLRAWRTLRVQVFA